jgi:outer membrane immunogenic protein
MRRLLITSVCLISAMAVFDPAIEPAFADEDIAKPRRERAQPRRAEPRRVEQRQATQSSNWNGGQLGGSNGGSSVNNVFVEPGAYVCPLAFPFGVTCFENLLSFSDRPLVYTVGAFAGYRWQFGTLVAGVEADASWKEAESTSSFARRDCFNGPCTIYRDDVKHGSITQGWDASVRGRFGVLVTPWTLLYATAGVAFSEIKGSFSYSGVIFDLCCTTSFARASGSWSEVRVGGTIGAGAETEIFPGIKARLEYRYADFGTYTKNLPVFTACVAPTFCSAPSNNVRIDLSPSFHTFRVGLGIDL